MCPDLSDLLTDSHWLFLGFASINSESLIAFLPLPMSRDKLLQEVFSDVFTARRAAAHPDRILVFLSLFLISPAIRLVCVLLSR